MYLTIVLTVLVNTNHQHSNGTQISSALYSGFFTPEFFRNLCSLLHHFPRICPQGRLYVFPQAKVQHTLVGFLNSSSF